MAMFTMIRDSDGMGRIRKPAFDASEAAWEASVSREGRSSSPLLFSECGENMTIRDVLKMLEADGWRLVIMQGSHRQFRHPTKPGRVTVAGKPSDDLPAGTLNSILKQSGLKR